MCTVCERLAVGLLTIAIGVPPAAGQQGQQSLRITGPQMLRLIEDGRYAAAERILRQQLERQTGGQVSYLLGVVLTRQLRFTEAATHLRHAVSVRPGEVRWRHALARALLGMGRCADAITELDRCLAIAPSPQERSVLHYDKAMCALNLGDFETAERSLRTALAGPEPPPHTRAKLGRLLIDRGDTDGALRLLESAAEDDPEDVEARFAYGLALRRARRLADAIAAFEAVVATVPGHTGALYNLGQCLALAGRAEEGRATLERFRSLSTVQDQIDNHRQYLLTAPEDLDARRSLALLLLQMGRNDEAVATLRAALAVAPADAETLTLMARALESQRQAAARAGEVGGGGA